jgi:DNA-binding PadR family transcriptional regulator
MHHFFHPFAMLRRGRGEMFAEHFRRHAMRGGRGMFGFGFDMEQGMDGGPGRGRGGFGGGRKLGSADLQLLILALLAEKPRHGYEIIKALDERSSGYYSPSPGMVYPALTYIEELGFAVVTAEGAKKLYTITQEGLDHLESKRAAVDALLEQLAWIGRKMEHVRRKLSGEEGERDGGDEFDEPHGRGGRHGKVALELRQARRNIKSALIEKFGSPLQEQLRVALILERAAAEIRGE